MEPEVNKDLSNVHTLPVGTPTISLTKGDLRLEFVVLSEVNLEGPPRSFCALVVRTWLVVPLAYENEFEAALDALRVVISGFLTLGYVASHTKIGENHDEA